MTILKHTGFNIGAIDKILVAYVSDIRDYNIISHTRVDRIRFNNREFEEIYFTPNKAKLSISPKQDKNGTYYEVVLNFIIPKLREEVVQSLENYRNKPLIVNVIDKNGNSLLLGTLEQPVKLLVDSDINQTVKEGSFFALKFSGKQIPYPYFFY